MRYWFKVGLISGFVAFLLSLLFFSSSPYNPAYSLFGKMVQGMRVFYALIFVSISFFTGITVGALKKRGEDRIDYYSKLFVIIFNGLAFFLVIGFGFSLRVWQYSLNNNYTWISIFAFVLLGIVVMLFVYRFASKRLKPKKL